MSRVRQTDKGQNEGYRQRDNPDKNMSPTVFLLLFFAAYGAGLFSGIIFWGAFGR